jgi:PAS domain S-box-containing protein
MHWVTMLWAGVATASLVLSAIQIAVWALDRRALPNLAFAISSLGLVGVAWCELAMMNSNSSHEWGEWVRWFHLPNFFMLVGMLVFVRLYLGAGRVWLFGLIAFLRAIILVSNFWIDPNFNFSSIDAVERIQWLGDSITIASRATPSPWQWIATLTTILSVLYIADACVAAWRSGIPEGRRRTLVVGIGISLFFIPAIVNTQLMIWGVWRTPTLIAPSFLVALAAMGLEMSREILRAHSLTRELQDSAQALQLAASAGGLGLWSWDARTSEVWTTSAARTMFGLADTDRISVDALAAMVVPEDIARLDECVAVVKETEAEQEIQFGIRTPDGSTRWILARGRCELEAPGRILRMRGVVRDVTEQHKTMQELEDLRARLAHSSRVTALGHLSSALAHELRQPLVAIQSNIESAEFLMQRPPPLELAELREILADIRRDDQRAADVIDRMRSLMKHHDIEQRPVSMDALLQDVIALVRSDATRRAIVLQVRIHGSALTVLGDRVHLSQVLINLIMNAMDAMSSTPPAQRRLIISANRNGEESIEVSVSDSGPGISQDSMPRLFDPFFTTKPSGMGIGLSVCRMIVDSHGGKLWAENNATGGATFRLTLSPHPA